MKFYYAWSESFDGLQHDLERGGLGLHESLREAKEFRAAFVKDNPDTAEDFKRQALFEISVEKVWQSTFSPKNRTEDNPCTTKP